MGKQTNKIFAFLFISTGFFAVIGALFTWGDGWLFAKENADNMLLPLADLIVSGPISLLAAFGVLYKKRWGNAIGLVTCGVYIFGSVLVYILVFKNGNPYPVRFLIPPIFGLGISIWFIFWAIQNKHV